MNYNLSLDSRAIINIEEVKYLFTYNPICNCIDFVSKVWKRDFSHFILKNQNHKKHFF